MKRTWKINPAFFLIYKKKQNNAPGTGFNALTIYIFGCMIFVAMAMLYYGFILFSLRKKLKIEDAEKSAKDKNIKLTNSVITCDRVMLVIYVLYFIIFNTSYFIYYSLTPAWGK